MSANKLCGEKYGNIKSHGSASCPEKSRVDFVPCVSHYCLASCGFVFVFGVPFTMTSSDTVFSSLEVEVETMTEMLAKICAFGARFDAVKCMHMFNDT